MEEQDQEKRSLYNKISGILLVFAFICLITSLFMNINSGSTIKKSVPPTGGELGPIRVKKDYSVYKIKVTQDLGSYGTWSFVNGDVLDENKNYLFSFGKELWKETGRDSDGTWSAKKTSFSLKVTLPKKGTYYLKFNTESNTSENDWVQVAVSPKQGSSLAHFILGVLGLIIGVGLWVLTNLEDSDEGDLE